MEELSPTLWRTCRVLSNESRLRMLWRLFESGEMSMGQLARSCGLGESSASMHLRALNARGLISAERRKLYVFYASVANSKVRHATDLLDALKACHDKSDPIPWIINQTTAFTHLRRIEIVKALSHGNLGTVDLSLKTRISPLALYRHVRKLIARGYVENNQDELCLTVQSHPLGQALLSAALD
jgi:DNA-binding transcriptional ArsR family regulator